MKCAGFRFDIELLGVSVAVSRLKRWVSTSAESMNSLSDGDASSVLPALRKPPILRRVQLPGFSDFKQLRPNEA